MTATSVWLGVLAAASILVALVRFTVLQGRFAGATPRGSWGRVAVTAVIGAAVTLALVVFRAPGIAPLFAAPIAALGAFFAVVSSSPVRVASRRSMSVYWYAAAATAFAALPATIVVFGTSFDPFATGLGYLDLGGALPGLVSAGSAGSAILWLQRRDAGPAVEAKVSWWSALRPAAALWAAWIVWLVGLELAIDSKTPIILTNAILMPISAAAAASVIERVSHRANTPLGLVTGLVAGLAAATPACAFLDPRLGVLVALIAGGVCALLPRRGPAYFLGPMVVGAGLGLILIGGLATNVSFIYTGQPEVLLGQVVGVLGAAVWSFAVSASLWALFRRIGAPERATLARSKP
ncbi:MAG TPA: hypothetical protein DCP11_07820 [Microbacteriaceae bacterium]|jgi:ammonia channel protein AmtB|nr:hypothetical protein [Microbacteriaceae bacterium]